LNDAEFDIQKARISKYLDKWLDRLPGTWTVSIRYYRGLIPNVDGFGVNDGAVMQVSVGWKYLRATIHVNLEEVADHSDDLLNLMSAHEVAHILVSELRGDPSDWLDHEEHACSVIANMLVETEEALPPTVGVADKDSVEAGA